MAAPKAPLLDSAGKKSKDLTLEADVFGAEVTFEPRTNFEVKVNRKTRRSALRGVLSEHAANGTFGILDGSGFSEPSTRMAVDLVAKWGQELPLVVVTKNEQNVAKSFRNID